MVEPFFEGARLEKENRDIRAREKDRRNKKYTVEENVARGRSGADALI